MAKLEDRVKFGLDEGRMLVLGAQVLIGFQYSAVFQKAFEQLSQTSRYLVVVALALLLVAVVLLVSSAPYHQIASRGQDSSHLLQYITATVAIALLPMALSLGIDVYLVGEKVGGQAIGLLAGGGALLLALFFWYGLELIQKSRHTPHGEARTSNAEGDKPMQQEKKDPGTDSEELKTRIDEILTEARVVLPGVQALLGFQFAIMLAEGFDKLPASSKYVHLASLVFITLSAVLLMTPAAYHRIVEQGEESEHFERFASRAVLSAMVPLALGLCGDFYVVLLKVTGSGEISLLLSAAMLAAIYGLWFGYTTLKRTQSQASKRAMASGLVKRTRKTDS